MYRHILVPIDGSDFGAAAIEQLPRLVGPESEVTLLQVIDTVAHVLAQTSPAGFPLGGLAGLSAGVAQNVVDSQRREALAHLESIAARLKTMGVQHVHLLVVEGAPGPSVISVANERTCDLIVMATHGRGGLGRAVLGSVADHVVRHSSGAPVLLVRTHAEQA